MNTYYLVKYSFYSSIGGIDEDIDIICRSHDRRQIERRMSNTCNDNTIKTINEVPCEDYTFNPHENKWRIEYNTTDCNIHLYKIIEKEEVQNEE